MVQDVGAALKLGGAGAGVDRTGPALLSEWHDPDRFLADLDLFRATNALRLLCTAGASPFRLDQRPEGQHYHHEAVLLGVPESATASTLLMLNG